LNEKSHRSREKKGRGREKSSKRILEKHRPPAARSVSGPLGKSHRTPLSSEEKSSKKRRRGAKEGERGGEKP